MDIDGQLVLDQALVDWKQLLTVQGLAVEIRKAAKASEPQLIDAALQFIERIPYGTGRQGEEPDKALWVFSTNCRDGIVGDLCKYDSVLAFKTVCAGGWNGQNMDIDPQLIHKL